MDIDNELSHANNTLTSQEYKQLWAELGPVEIKMIERIGLCPHDLGDSFIYKNPYEKPQGLCSALLHVLDLYVWRVVLGFPSWEADDRTIYRVHCPSKLGTVWEMKKF